MRGQLMESYQPPTCAAGRQGLAGLAGHCWASSSGPWSEMLLQCCWLAREGREAGVCGS